MSEKDKERDDYWEIDKLVPKKKPVMTPFTTAEQVAEHTIDGEADKNADKRKLTAKSAKSSKTVEVTGYRPENKGLIKSVTIKRTVDKYDFYESFRNAALIYYDFKSPKCDFTPFYSFLPQYHQMKPNQKNYYFYWRDEARRGKFLKTDFCYIYLYVYEILNLPDKIPPEKGIRTLCRLWREYRKSFQRIDSNFALWIQDYCFVHNVPCPMEEIRDFVFDAIAASEFKEFYLSDMDSAGNDGAEAMMAYLSDYDWRKGKSYTDDNVDIFRNHICGVMKKVFKVLCADSYSAENPETAILKRKGFPNSLCTHAVKCDLEIEYVPLSSNDDLRRDVTACVRYAENKLRSLFGVKSRLGVKDIPDFCRSVIDKYFDSIFEMERIRRESELAPEYEKLYNVEKRELSFADADEIERASWTTTVRLVDSEELAPDAIPEAADAVTASAETAASEQTPDEPAADPVDTYGLSDEDIELIRCAMRGEGEVIDDEAFERINEAFSEGFGDIILEHDGEKYTVLEDYTDELEQWLGKL